MHIILRLQSQAASMTTAEILITPSMLMINQHSCSSTQRETEEDRNESPSDIHIPFHLNNIKLIYTLFPLSIYINFMRSRRLHY